MQNTCDVSSQIINFDLRAKHIIFQVTASAFQRISMLCMFAHL